jgi:hypothetical protein
VPPSSITSQATTPAPPPTSHLSSDVSWLMSSCTSAVIAVRIYAKEDIYGDHAVPDDLLD